MKQFLKSLQIGFSVIGVISVSLLIVYFTTFTDSPKVECTEALPSDTTRIEFRNGLEDFANFKKAFVTNYKFQVNRAKFPVPARGNLWGGVKIREWTLCNWKSLTPYYLDTITYTIQDVKHKENTPFEKYEQIVYVQDSSIVTTVMYKNISGKWLVVERTDKSK